MLLTRPGAPCLVSDHIIFLLYMVYAELLFSILIILKLLLVIYK